MGTITVTNLGKAYKQYPNRWSRLMEWLVPFSKPRHQLKWVLQDLNFKVNAGEAIGIIGINGAGKSTLLKMITGTTQPTAGSVSITGRVAALLELGMGFHPDFTGRQNAVMAGQLLGMSVEEISRLMAEIEAFAEIGEYMDQPLRVYSSGMQMRVAFSVATARRPDVLIVDEALSVGDDYFQHKSFERIREFRRLGTTLLIVSHDKQAIQSICDRAIMLDAGRVAKEGGPEAVMDYYNAMIAYKENSKIEQTALASGRVRTISGTGEARVKSSRLLDALTGDELTVAKVGQALEFRLEASIHVDIPQLVLGCMIRDKQGHVIWGTNTGHTNQVQHDLCSGDLVSFSLKFRCDLGPSSYSFSVALCSADSHIENNYEWSDNLLVFEVINVNKPFFVGVNWLDAHIFVERESTDGLNIH